MKKILCLFILSLTFHVCLFAQANDELKQAKIALKEKKYNEAIALLDKVIAQTPNAVLPHFLKGLAYIQTHNAAQAIAEFDWSLRKDPAHSNIYFYRALAKEKKGDDQAALRDLETAVLLKGDNPLYYYHAAKIHTRLKQYGEAKMNYQQASNLSPDNQQMLEEKDQAIAQMPTDIDDTFMMRSRGIDGAVIGFEKQIEQASFGSLVEGKELYDQIGKAKLAAGSKKTLLAGLRMKIMRDVYGSQELFREDIEDLQFTIQSEDWLLPDAMSFVFDLTANSPNWFSEVIECNGMLYRYQVTKGREDKDFNMDIYAVKNDETHNIYNSNIKVSSGTEGQTNMDIFLMLNKGYVRKVILGSYLRATFSEGKIDYTEVGKMATMKTDVLADCLAQNPQMIQPADESIVSGMKALVRNLIFNYSLQFDNIE